MALGRLVGDWRDGARRYHQAAGRTLSFERSASLVVRVTINKAFKSPLLFKDVYEFKEKARAPGERADFSWRSHGRLHDYFHAEQYVHIGVRNNSNRKLSSLTFCAHSIGGAMLQIGDGEMIEVKADQPIPLGDLQPRREIILHLLAGSFSGGYTPKDIKANLVFSADELGKVAYKLPLPFYQRMRWRGSLRLLGACVWHIDLGGNRGFSAY